METKRKTSGKCFRLKDENVWPLFFKQLFSVFFETQREKSTCKKIKTRNDHHRESFFGIPSQPFRRIGFLLWMRHSTRCATSPAPTLAKLPLLRRQARSPGLKFWGDQRQQPDLPRQPNKPFQQFHHPVDTTAATQRPRQLQLFRAIFDHQLVCPNEYHPEECVPRLLSSCGHTFCETCLPGLQNSASNSSIVRWPSCRVETAVEAGKGVTGTCPKKLRAAGQYRERQRAHDSKNLLPKHGTVRDAL